MRLTGAVFLHYIRWLVFSTTSLSLLFLMNVQVLLAWMSKASCTLAVERLVNVVHNLVHNFGLSSRNLGSRDGAARAHLPPMCPGFDVGPVPYAG